ncbi:MAG: glycine oxidase ThiO [Acidobacteriaceae bacterium]|nr:glycine oxidase ThiO [Acidobacteriaceae bacterium]MBV9780277.1 glycine oxidase ThiO [Acidobacteriaceae bacterium]
MSQRRTVPTARSIGIVGGGVIGLSLAWQLAQRGWRVSLFDKGEVGGEASWAAAGMLSPGGEIERSSALAPLATESRALYSKFIKDLEEASGLAIDYQECGALDMAYSQREWDALKVRAADQRGIGINSKEISPEDVSVFWPRVRRGGLAGALFFPGDATVNARELTIALAAACRHSGVLLAQNCAVESVEISEAEAALATRCGIEAFAAVVIAAGAWSSSVAVTGVPALPSVEPVKGHLIGYQQPEQTCPTIVRHGHTYLLQRASGLLICGSTIEYVGFDRVIDHQVVSALEEQAAFMLPHLRETTVSETWIGFRPGSEALRMGTWHSDRLYLAYGHFRNGILLAPITAAHITNQISANLRTP